MFCVHWIDFDLITKWFFFFFRLRQTGRLRKHTIVCQYSTFDLTPPRFPLRPWFFLPNPYLPLSRSVMRVLLFLQFNRNSVLCQLKNQFHLTFAKFKFRLQIYWVRGFIRQSYLTFEVHPLKQNTLGRLVKFRCFRFFHFLTSTS